MKKFVIIIIFISSSRYMFSQVNNPRVSPVHVGSFSNNNISYVVGKIYVLPLLGYGKQSNEKDQMVNNIKIYPNPVTNILTIETLDKSEVKFITVSDMNGKLIYSNKLENSRVDLSFLKQGFYTIILDNNKIKTYKIIKN
jgi:hypothetical protein